MNYSAGYYEVILRSTSPKLKVLVLNTNLYLTGNSVTEDETDPGDQFSWAEERLQDAVINNYKVNFVTYFVSLVSQAVISTRLGLPLKITHYFYYYGVCG